MIVPVGFVVAFYLAEMFIHNYKSFFLFPSEFKKCSNLLFLTNFLTREIKTSKTGIISKLGEA